MKDILSKKDFPKMRWFIVFYIFIFSILAFSSCVTQEESRRTSDEIISLNRRINKLEETIDA